MTTKITILETEEEKPLPRVSEQEKTRGRQSQRIVSIFSPPTIPPTPLGKLSIINIFLNRKFDKKEVLCI
jgi:hypothetical protein